MHKEIPMTKGAREALKNTPLPPGSVLIAVGEETVGTERLTWFTFAVPAKNGYTVTNVYQ